ncbi:ATP-binding protein [Belliella kenyensis]|uniref:histidine kinase n=1 Tax=Belliella kenyensis TaxID=1472724 RepID=A0ABV8EM52_9BACT|nr:ATP-binding protein [Belliella kenyensis]MCH7403533.1 ATP-binding protein [Belliella kenyensis]MDN3604945.1 ATP-binding protein [Belliella kenyensis]
MKRISKTSLLHKYPIALGIFVFLVISGLQYFTVKDYELKKRNEEQYVNEYSLLIEKQINAALSNSIAITRVLEFLEKKDSVTFDEFVIVSKDFLETNTFIDAIQLVEQGRIKFTYPLEGNEAAIGFDILNDPVAKGGALMTIERKKLYFAGPIHLKQGGLGIIGRRPIFKNDVFWGFAAVIIKLDSFLLAQKFDNPDRSNFYVQLSSINKETGEEEFFLPKSPKSYDGYKKTVFMRDGDWKLSIQLKKSTAFQEVYPFLFIRIFLSIILGYMTYHIARTPSILTKLLEERSREIKESNERFEYVTQATSDGIWDWDLQTGKVYRTPIFERLFGYRLEMYQDSMKFWWSLLELDELKKLQQELNNFFQSNQQNWEAQYKVRTAEGKFAYVLEKGIVIRDKESKPLRLIGAVVDVTESKVAEMKLIHLSEELANRAKKLEVSNEELEQFAYIASHDLQEPLRMVTGFLNRLEMKYSNVLDEKAKEYIYYATDGAKRMRQVILDLLTYSRIGTSTEESKVIVVEQAIREVIKLNKSLIDETSAQISWNELPKIKIQETPFVQLLQNLIGNAIKYRRSELNPEIHIASYENELEWIFEVADNGIGIEEDYLEKIFIIFQKLHPKSEYEGSGIGLAICKKIIDRFGGKIWVESKVNHGSKFIFTIPKKLN